MIPLLSVKQFLNDLRRQKLRTLMTTFGIFWGTCAIVLLFAFGNGISEAQLKSQKGMGENIAIIWPGITSKEFKGLPRGRRIRMTENDVVMLKNTSQTIGRISPEYSRWNVNFKFEQNVIKENVVGIWPEFGDMRNLIADYGSRFINDRDMKEKRRVIFLGDLLKKDLFGSKEAVGERVLLNNVPFKVVGILKTKKQDSSYNGRDARKGFIPSSTFKAMFSQRFLNDVVMQPAEKVSMELAKDDIYKLLGSKYRFDPTDKEALSIWDTSEGFRFLSTFFTAFRYFLVGIGIATLITGGIGVSNIMNVVLEERTKEIGIKMALGARKSFILFQFVFETLIITGVGGIFGYLFAYGIIKVFPLLNLGEFVGVPTVDGYVGITVIILLGLVGLAAGIFPARRAANLQPVQALKLF